MKNLIYILTILLTLAICSCRSIQYVPIESKTQIKDYVEFRDSVITKELINQKDSVIYRDSTVMVMDDKGNVLRTELYKEKEVYRDMQKEYANLLSKYNSLLSEKTDSVQVPYPVEKQLTRWESLKMSVGGYSIGIIIIIVLIVVGWLVYKLKK